MTAELVIAHNAVLVFQRFEAPAHAAGFTVVDPAEDLARQYNAGGYALIYIALENPPKAPQDWDFLDREAANLIELAGGRQQGRELEQVTIRPLAKRSNAKKLFGALRAAIAASCKQGVLLDGHPYPEIFYAPELASQELRLWVDLDTKTIQAQIAG